LTLPGVEQPDRSVQFFHVRNMPQVFAWDHAPNPWRACRQTRGARIGIIRRRQGLAPAANCRFDGPHCGDISSWRPAAWACYFSMYVEDLLKSRGPALSEENLLRRAGRVISVAG
jgi:hypothetical protein